MLPSVTKRQGAKVHQQLLESGHIWCLPHCHTLASPWMGREEIKLQAGLIPLLASFQRNTGKTYLILFCLTDSLTFRTKHNWNLAVSPVANVGTSVKVHPKASSSPLPEKRMLWASCIPYCCSFSIFLLNLWRKWCVGFGQEDSEAADAFRSCWR